MSENTITLTDEQYQESIKTAVSTAVDEMVEKLGLNKIERKFTPSAGIEAGDVTADENDKKLSDPKGGFKSFGHFCYDVMKASGGRTTSETLREWDTVVKTTGHMEEGDDSQGGYLVPTEFRAQLIERSLEASIVRGKAVVVPMQTNRVVIPAQIDTTHAAGAFFGGVTIYRPGEAGTKTASKPTFGQVALTLHKLTGLVYVSDELLADSPIAIEAVVNSRFSQAIAFVEDDDFLNGNGANQALGAFNAANPSLIAQAKETGQAAATIVYENIIKMWSRLYPAGQGNAVWIANIECFPQLAQMNMAVGTGGIPVWMPAGGISGSPYQSLMGRPLLYTEKMQALGTQGDIGLADFSQYLIGEKAGGAGIQTATSIHVYFVYDETAFRFVLRYDGQPSWLSTLTPRRGSSTLSPFVVLAVRT